ncbi:hypothetical protein [Devosia nitrariae]|uniref:Uncharacterized protein n=1 Tax=Devosia nitrariae TaxID=2071872 RepID=A0ABQ5WC22_9HYPH|nr:hypothetical protein [Devosia nitrariae]GLQ57299.1 hypothetical protein GCM10010862_45580 [Devosia nitrariae]
MKTPDPIMLRACTELEQALYALPEPDDVASVDLRLRIEEVIETAYEFAYGRGGVRWENDASGTASERQGSER